MADRKKQAAACVKVNAMQMKIGQFTDTFLPIVDGVGRVVQAYSETLCRM